MPETNQDTVVVPMWVARLEKKIGKINGGTITAAEGRHLLVDVAFGVVDTAKRLGAIERYLRQSKKEDSDLMRSGLSWFSDKVLPVLITSGILAGIYWLAAVNDLLPK